MSRTPHTNRTISLASGSGHFAFVLFLVVGIFAWQIWMAGWPDGLRGENGAPEIASLLVAIDIVLLTAAIAKNTRAVSWLAPAVLAVLLLRELDFHDWFFEPGLLHTGIFSAPVPIWQKLVSGTAMLGLLVLAGRAVYLGAPKLWRGLVSREGWVIVLGLSGAAAFVANSIDGIGRKLAPYGIEVRRDTIHSLELAEEFLELVFFLGLVLAIMLYARRRLCQGNPACGGAGGSDSIPG